MGGPRLLHELDALDLAAIWPVSGQSGLALCTLRQVGRAQARSWRRRTRGRAVMDEDALHFERRSTEEFLAAAKAQHPRARDAHLKMAQFYQDLASTGTVR